MDLYPALDKPSNNNNEILPPPVSVYSNNPTNFEKYPTGNINKNSFENYDNKYPPFHHKNNTNNNNNRNSYEKYPSSSNFNKNSFEKYPGSSSSSINY